MRLFQGRAAIMILAFVLGITMACSGQTDAASVYKTKCQVCHGADGKGDTTMGKKLGARDFHSPEVTKLSDAELFKVTKEGKEKMPAYDKKLTDDQIQALVKYIRALK
jgi:mono/diheme cytochrome c family protein